MIWVEKMTIRVHLGALKLIYVFHTIFDRGLKKRLSVRHDAGFNTAWYKRAYQCKLFRQTHRHDINLMLPKRRFWNVEKYSAKTSTHEKKIYKCHQTNRIRPLHGR